MNEVSIRIDASRLSAHELAVVGATVTAVLAARATPPSTDGVAAWRRAGLLEAVRHRSIDTPVALELARRR